MSNLDFATKHEELETIHRVASQTHRCIVGNRENNQLRGDQFLLPQQNQMCKSQICTPSTGSGDGDHFSMSASLYSPPFVGSTSQTAPLFVDPYVTNTNYNESDVMNEGMLKQWHNFSSRYLPLLRTDQGEQMNHGSFLLPFNRPPGPHSRFAPVYSHQQFDQGPIVQDSFSRPAGKQLYSTFNNGPMQPKIVCGNDMKSSSCQSLVVEPTSRLLDACDESKKQTRSKNDKITFEEIRPLFGMTLANAANQLGICITHMKKICRDLKIEKWPYRQIHSLETRLAFLERAVTVSGDRLSAAVKKSYEERIISIKAEVERVKNNVAVEPQLSTCHDGDENREAPTLKETQSNSVTMTSLHIAPGAALEPAQVTSKCGNNADSNESMSRKSGKKRRYDTTYDYQTGWVANCSSCGKVGKYRHPSEGRVFQHSSGSGKYCGYYRDNPRPAASAYVSSTGN